MSEETAEATGIFAPAPAGERLWRNGTLVYTAGGLVALFCWLLLGDFTWAMKERSVAVVVQLLFKNFGASDTLNALFMGTLPSAIGLVLGPVVSYRSDRLRSPWGRRIPFLLFTTPIASLAMIGLAFSPRLGESLHGLLGANSPGVNSLTLFCMGGFWVIFEVATVVANMIFTALINDVVPNALIGRFYGLFRAFSLIAGIIFNFWLLGQAERYYVHIFVCIAAMYGAGFLLMCRQIREGQYPPPPPPQGVIRGIRAYFRESFSHAYYRLIFLGLIVSGLVFMPVNLFSLFYAKSLDVSMDDYGSFIAATFVISLCLSWFLGVLADRFHPLRVGMATLALYAVVAPITGLLIQGRLSFGAALILHCVISGIYFTGTASLPQRLFPQGAFLQLCSACGIIGSITNMLATALLGRFLDWSGHNYRLTYLIGAGAAVVALGCYVLVYRRFMALGGEADYRAPEITSALK